VGNAEDDHGSFSGPETVPDQSDDAMDDAFDVDVPVLLVTEWIGIVLGNLQYHTDGNSISNDRLGNTDSK
jgi:hypothetical protein